MTDERAEFEEWWKTRGESMHPSMRFVLGEIAFDGWQAAMERSGRSELLDALRDLAGACGQASFALRELLPDDPDARMSVDVLTAPLESARSLLQKYGKEQE